MGRRAQWRQARAEAATAACEANASSGRPVVGATAVASASGSTAARPTVLTGICDVPRAVVAVLVIVRPGSATSACPPGGPVRPDRRGTGGGVPAPYPAVAISTRSATAR